MVLLGSVVGDSLLNGLANMVSFRRLFIDGEGSCRKAADRALSEYEQPSPNRSDSRVMRNERSREGVSVFDFCKCSGGIEALSFNE